MVDATYGCSSRQHDFNCFAGNKAAEIISLCAPYGVDAATGDINPNAVKSSLTLALGGIFIGLIFGRAPDYIGRVEVVDIPPAVKPCAFIADAEYVRPAKKLLSSHKGDNGKVSIIGGSDTMPGRSANGILYRRGGVEVRGRTGKAVRRRVGKMRL